MSFNERRSYWRLDQLNIVQIYLCRVVLGAYAVEMSSLRGATCSGEISRPDLFNAQVSNPRYTSAIKKNKLFFIVLKTSFYI